MTAVLLCAGPGSVFADQVGADQPDALAQLVAHFGKVVELPTRQRVVFYAPRNEVWLVDENGSILSGGGVITQPRPDWQIELIWKNGDVDVLDAENADQIRLIDDTPPLLDHLAQFRDQPLAHAVGDLPKGTQFMTGGSVFAGDAQLGLWQVHLKSIWFRAEDGSATLIDPADLAAAVKEQS